MTAHDHGCAAFVSSLYARLLRDKQCQPLLLLCPLILWMRVHALQVAGGGRKASITNCVTAARGHKTKSHLPSSHLYEISPNILIFSPRARNAKPWSFTSQPRPLSFTFSLFSYFILSLSLLSLAARPLCRIRDRLSTLMTTDREKTIVIV